MVAHDTARCDCCREGGEGGYLLGSSVTARQIWVCRRARPSGLVDASPSYFTFSESRVFIEN
jgi:hypothetical protein